MSALQHWLKFNEIAHHNSEKLTYQRNFLINLFSAPAPSWQWERKSVSQQKLSRPWSRFWILFRWGYNTKSINCWPFPLIKDLNPFQNYEIRMSLNVTTINCSLLSIDHFYLLDKKACSFMRCHQLLMQKPHIPNNSPLAPRIFFSRRGEPLSWFIPFLTLPCGSGWQT